MAEYPVDATNFSEPLDSRIAKGAAEELRALKRYIQQVLLPKVQAVKFPAGAMLPTYRTVAPAGWVMHPITGTTAAGHIGNASSGGTVRANADTIDLFAVLWAHPATQLFSAGGATLGKGGSAAEDFANNRAISFPPYAGRVPALAAVDSVHALWSSVGQDSTTLTVANLPAHTHHFFVKCQSDDSEGSGAIPTGENHHFDNSNGYGGDTDPPAGAVSAAIENRQPTVYMNWIVSL